MFVCTHHRSMSASFLAAMETRAEDSEEEEMKCYNCEQLTFSECCVCDRPVCDWCRSEKDPCDRVCEECIDYWTELWSADEEESDEESDEEEEESNETPWPAVMMLEFGQWYTTTSISLLDALHYWRTVKRLQVKHAFKKWAMISSIESADRHLLERRADLLRECERACE